MYKKPSVNVIGAGLAGCEAAWQLASYGLNVSLWEMKPVLFSPAHSDPLFAELVCSNSFGSYSSETGAGLLQKEAEIMNSLVIDTAKLAQVPAGRALAVDRKEFSRLITEKIENNPSITIIRKPVYNIPESEPTLFCTGPLTEPTLANELSKYLGKKSLYFYDAIAPIVVGDSINYDRVFLASRYEDGVGDYLNCPFTREEYESFVDSITKGEQYPAHDFEKERLFHGCQPIEVMASSGKETLAFGPMKPVGLTDPKTGERPYAVVQLRKEDKYGQLWNIVGFQTKLKHQEQVRIFKMIPGLENASFARLGSIHRNTFINAPELLNLNLSLKQNKNIYFGGQISGVEGYLESSVSGLMSALFIISDIYKIPLAPPPSETMTGGLLRYLRESKPEHFQPMNANFGLLAPLEGKIHKSKRKEALANRANLYFTTWWEKWIKDVSIQAN